MPKRQRKGKAIEAETKNAKKKLTNSKVEDTIGDIREEEKKSNLGSEEDEPEFTGTSLLFQRFPK